MDLHNPINFSQNGHNQVPHNKCHVTKVRTHTFIYIYIYLYILIHGLSFTHNKYEHGKTQDGNPILYTFIFIFCLLPMSQLLYTYVYFNNIDIKIILS